MAKVEFVEGFQCQKCGNIIISSKIKSKLCQKCGARIFYLDIFTQDIESTNNLKPVKLKIIRKLFKKTVEIIEEE